MVVVATGMDHGTVDLMLRVWQDILETWRLRTPNEWESLGTWADVLTWRNAIYNVVINAFKNVGDMAPHLHQLGYRDKAWCAPILQHNLLFPHPC